MKCHSLCFRLGRHYAHTCEAHASIDSIALNKRRAENQFAKARKEPKNAAEGGAKKVPKTRNRRIADEFMSKIEEACSIHTKHCGCCKKTKVICTGCNKDVLLDLELGTASEGEGSESF